MNYYRILIALIVVLLFISCSEANEKKIVEKKNTSYESVDGHKVTVLEVINGSVYSYLRVSENGNENWIAISKRMTQVGETLYYNDVLEMKNFKSKELGKTFETIGFVNKVSDKPITPGEEVESEEVKKKEPKLLEADISIEPVKDVVTIAELYSNSSAFDGKSVVVKGEVVKFSSEIMNTNWVHIEDGTNHEGNKDLTITTNEKLKVGDVVTLKGTIAASKDFGSGYFYDVIMESATIVPSKEI